MDAIPYAKNPRILRTIVYGGSIAMHVALLSFGCWQDTHPENFGGVKYTDVDYRVFTDAAEHIRRGRSPYMRHTYRYTPLLALLMIPNVTLSPLWGKCLFSLTNLAIGYVIEKILKYRLTERYHELDLKRSKKQDANSRRSATSDITTPTSIKKGGVPGIDAEVWAIKLTAIWMLNPFPLQVATRGNADSLPSMLVVLFLYFLLRRKILSAALCFATGVHIKIFPIIHALPVVFFLYPTFLHQTAACSLKKPTNLQLTLRSLHQEFSSRQIFKFFLSSLAFLVFLMASFFYFYGWEFLYEGYIYHVVRKDHRHNLSPYFYFLYLAFEQPSNGYPFYVKLTTALMPVCQWCCTLAVGIYFARRRGFIEFGAFLQTIIFVAFNKVFTVQYFIWWMALLPLAFGCVVNLNGRGAVTDTDRQRLSQSSNCRIFFTFAVTSIIWVLTQGMWMYWAYRLEFLGEPTFLWIFTSGWLFFASSLSIAAFFIRLANEASN